MQLLDVQFELAGELDAVRGLDHEVLLLDSPHLRFNNRNGLKLNPYGLGPFSRLVVPLLPDTPGVYAVTAEAPEVLYVGRARDSLRVRWSQQGYAAIHPRNCYVGGQSTNCRINGLVTDGLRSGRRFALWYRLVDPPDDLEERLRWHLQPPWNLR